MRHTRSFNGTGEGMGGAYFIEKSASGEPVPVFKNVLLVDVTLTGREAEAYGRRYNPQHHGQASASWFDMEWMGKDAPQLRLTIRPDVAKNTQHTVEADALATRAVRHLERLLRGEV